MIEIIQVVFPKQPNSFKVGSKFRDFINESFDTV